ncbi:hypothetical protein AB3Y40_12935 [Yoonia sp. R2331]|uniref:hypothetical protein n=1 Tax=Yoonia sp. R2331 TaxID=3237238 RepID=UPI0034E39445
MMPPMNLDLIKPHNNPRHRPTPAKRDAIRRQKTGRADRCAASILALRRLLQRDLPRRTAPPARLRMQ